MNYYEHHIGDYDEATAHLTACEDGIYARMIRKYYATEAPLVADLEKLKKLVRARTPEERQAVDDILDEFFELREDGWHQETCDERVTAFQVGQPQRDLKRINAENRTHRHREERAKLFEIITKAGQHAEWNMPMGPLRALAASISGIKQAEIGAPVTRAATSESNGTATAPATPVTATNTRVPIPKHQSPTTSIKRKRQQGDVEVVARKQAKTPKPETLQVGEKKAPRKAAPDTGTRLDKAWVLPKSWGEWALERYPHWTPDQVRSIAESFRDHWSAKPDGRDARKVDWLATWRNWCKSGITQRENPPPRGPLRAGAATSAQSSAKNAEAEELVFGPGTALVAAHG